MSNFIDYIPVTNYSCTYNPNPNYTPDCTGTKTTTTTTTTTSGTNTSGGNNTPTGTILPNITKQFTLYQNKLPITIPSTVNPMKDSNYKSDSDPNVKDYWLPTPPYSDNSVIYDNSGNARKQTDITKWGGFNNAISKCIELDGTNGKKNCYAVSVQSDFIGNSTADSKLDHSFNYFLVELPTIDKIDQNFAVGKDIDNNFLFCQPQFYTWVKNLNSGVYNPYAPRYNPNNTPNSSFRLSCDPERYPEQQRDEDNANFFKKKEDDDFWAPSAEVPIPFVPPPKKPNEDNSKRNMIIGVVVAIIVLGGGYYWYTHFGPGATPSATPSPTVAKIVTPAIPKTVSATIKKTKGGYFFY